MSHKNPIVALLGNPNSGKSSIFNHLTGLRQRVGNFPGVTVEKKYGEWYVVDVGRVTLIDFPGAYSLHPNSDDERVVLEVLANEKSANYPELVVYVADSGHLDKHLLLLTQVQDLNIPVVLVLTMEDERNEVEIDREHLLKELGVNALSVNGRNGVGLDDLEKEIGRLLSGGELVPKEYRMPVEAKSATLELKDKLVLKNDFISFLLLNHFESLSFLNKNERSTIADIRLRYNYSPLKGQVDETMGRYDRLEPILSRTVTTRNDDGWTGKIDDVLMHRFWGPVSFFAIMFLVFQAIYSWATYPMDWIEWGIGVLGSLLDGMISSEWLSGLLVDGVLAGIGGVLVFIPQIAILFLLVSLLEEVGYMSRAVLMFDGVMRRFGLNGRSIVALISSSACAIPAIMSTRTIGNWKERLITIFVSPLISCSARIPVYIVLIGLIFPDDRVMGVFNLRGLAFMGLYLLGILSALLSALVLKWIIKQRTQSMLMIQLPAYKAPVWRNVLLNVKEKVSAFIFETGKIIIVISMLLWVLASFGPGDSLIEAEEDAVTHADQIGLSQQERENLIAASRLETSYIGIAGQWIEPIIKPLGYDWKIGIALITSFAAREVFVGTMATIYSIGSEEDEFRIQERMANEVNLETGRPVYTLATSLSLLLFYVFALQCMSTLAVVKSETRSWKWPIIQFVSMTALAYLSAWTVYQLFN